jgi:hypothetical protein
VYDAAAQTLTLTFKQSTPTTSGQLQENKLPLFIPIGETFALHSITFLSCHNQFFGNLALLIRIINIFVFDCMFDPSFLHEFSTLTPILTPIPIPFYAQ